VGTPGLSDLDYSLSAVEVSPVYDNPGETTILAAAEVALSLIGLMVKTPVA
jgi:arginase family enzyme